MEEYEMIRKSKLSIFVILVAIILFSSISTNGLYGQNNPVKMIQDSIVTNVRPAKTHYQYAVKLICGLSRGKIVANGKYYTAINVHNPSDSTVVFKKKIAIAYPDSAGPISAFSTFSLGPDEAMEFDCPRYMTPATNKIRFMKGFVVIESHFELDVVAVYTAGHSKTGEVTTLHTERVPARHVGGCPDLIVENIEKPVWDNVNKRSVIKATIKNIGNISAFATWARLMDNSVSPIATSVAATPALEPGQVANITFYLNYWVYNPDAEFKIMADYKKDLPECNENNNEKEFNEIG